MPFHEILPHARTHVRVCRSGARSSPTANSPACPSLFGFDFVFTFPPPPSFYLRTYSACARATYINGEGTRWRRGVGHLSEGIRDPSLFTCPGRGFDSRSLGIAIASSFDAHVRPRTRYEGIKMLRKFGLIIRRVSVIRSRRTRPQAEEAPSCLSSGFFSERCVGAFGFPVLHSPHGKSGTKRLSGNNFVVASIPACQNCYNFLS